MSSAGESPAKNVYGNIYRSACGTVALTTRQTDFLLDMGLWLYVGVVVARFLLSYLPQFVDLDPLAGLRRTTLWQCAVSLVTLSNAFYIYALGALPIWIAKKAYIDEFSRPTVGRNRVEDLRRLAQDGHARVVIITYALSAVVISLCCYDFTLTATGRSVSWLLYPGSDNMWCPSYRKDHCKSDAPMLNEYRVINVTNSLFFGICYAIDCITRRKFQLRFYGVRPEPQFSFALSQWRSVVPSLLKKFQHPAGLLRAMAETATLLDLSSLRFLSGFMVCCWLLHVMFWNSLYQTFLWLVPMGNVEYEWMKPLSLDVGLVIQTFVNSTTCLMCWWLIDSLFQHYFTTVVFASSPFMDPNGVLVDGLRAHDQPYVQRLAFLELWHVSRDVDCVERRITIYKEHTRDTWRQISRACMDVILRIAHDAHAQIAEQRKKQIEALKRSEKRLPHTSSKQVLNIRTITTADNRNEPGNWTRPTETDATMPSTEGAEDILDRQIPTDYLILRTTYSLPTRWIMDTLIWSLHTSIERKTSMLCRDKHVVVYAVEALTALTKQSLSLDPYGIVQGDLPRVFECLIDCLLALEKYGARPPLEKCDMRAPSDIQLRCLMDVFALVQVLKEALYDMGDAFFQYLDTIKLPPAHKTRFDEIMSEHL